MSTLRLNPGNSQNHQEMQQDQLCCPISHTKHCFIKGICIRLHAQNVKSSTGTLVQWHVYIPPMIGSRNIISNTNYSLYKHLSLCQTKGRDIKVDIITRNNDPVNIRFLKLIT